MMSRLSLAAFVVVLAAPALADAQPASGEPKSVQDKMSEFGAAVFEVFQKPIHPSLEPIAPTAGLTGGIGISPKSWRNEARIRTLRARASASTRGYWAIDGSFAWQQSNSWRIEPYIRLRTMKRLNFFGLGNNSLLSNRADFSLLERSAGAYGWKRPVPWLAVGGRGEILWPRTSSGKSPDLPSIEEQFAVASIPGFGEDSDFVHLQGFVNLNYPAGRNERPRRGGDYRVALGRFQDTSVTRSSFQRLEVEGQERFTVFGRDRQLTLHALLSASYVPSGQKLPFYLMDTLGGADNLRGFREDIIGSDETTATLRSFENFRFRDGSSVLLQAEFRQRLWSQVFIGIFGDAGTVAPSPGDLRLNDLRRGFGVSLGIFRANVLAIRADFSIIGGEGHPYFIVPGKAFGF